MEQRSTYLTNLDPKPTWPCSRPSQQPPTKGGGEMSQTRCGRTRGVWPHPTYRLSVLPFLWRYIKCLGGRLHGDAFQIRSKTASNTSIKGEGIFRNKDHHTLGERKMSKLHFHISFQLDQYREREREELENYQSCRLPPLVYSVHLYTQQKVCQS